MPNPLLYFDTAATTPVAAEAIQAMLSCLGSDDCYYNPSAPQYSGGRAAAQKVAFYRAEIAQALGCHPDEVIFTSGATEANNLALCGIARANQAHGRHLITSAIEHKSVLNPCHALEQEGFTVTYLRPNRQGWVEAEAVREALRPDTLLVSLMHTNNETGVMQPIAAIAELLAQAGVLFHVDAAQAVGKLPLDLNAIPLDLLSFSAHKFYGPKGIGCLILRNRKQTPLQPLMWGGGQEFGLRPGTLATHQIAGMSTALRVMTERIPQDLAHITQLKQQFVTQLGHAWPLQINGDSQHSSPYIVNFSLAGISSDALINQLSDKIALSSGSACSAGTFDPSFVLRAMGIEGDALYGAVRVSFGPYHTSANIATAVAQIVAAVERIQALSR